MKTKKNTIPDLTYIKKGLLTSFLPNTKEGETPYKQMLANPETKNATIYTIHLKSVLYQLKKAGYIVKKAKKVTDKDIDAIFNDPLFKELIN